MTRPKNPKGQPFTWSYTALSHFENCPRGYAEERYYKNVQFVENEAIRDGNRGHKCAEDFLKGVTPEDPVYLDKVKPYANAMCGAANVEGGELLIEYEIALSKDMNPVKWFSKDAWFRGKLDATVVVGRKANIYDWKFGKKPKDNPDQLNIFACSLSIVRPDIEKFNPKFIYPKQQVVIGCKEIVKEQIPNIWAGVLQRVHRMEEAWKSENFPARPSGLCPWCSSFDSCPYARGGRR